MLQRFDNMLKKQASCDWHYIVAPLLRRRKKKEENSTVSEFQPKGTRRVLQRLRSLFLIIMLWKLHTILEMRFCHELSGF